jgi:hypothetical protein
MKEEPFMPLAILGIMLFILCMSMAIFAGIKALIALFFGAF